MTQEILVGVVGAGTLGKRLSKQVESVPSASVVAVADVNLDAATELASRFAIDDSQIYESYKVMYNQAPIEAIIIATPHCFHYEQIVDALDHDYDILTEKPLVTDLDEAEQIAVKAEESEAIVMVGFQRRIQSVFKRARERYRDGGPEVRFVDATLTEHWLELKDGTWRTNYEYSGGGFFTDAVRHLIDAILWITDLDPVAVDSRMEFHREGIESSGVLTIHLANDAKVTITAFADARTIREEYYFCDENGSVLIEGHGWDQSDRKSLVIVDGDSWDRTRPHLPQHKDPGKGEVFIDCIQNDRTPPATIENSLKIIELIQAARESAKTGDTVTLSSAARWSMK